MKYVYQFGVIIGVSFLGEILNTFIPLPIPASIYGLLIMLFCLTTGIIKLEKIKETSNFLLNIMSIMFLPACVGIITIWDKIADILLPITVITCGTTIFVMVVTGKVTEYIMKLKELHKEA